MSRLVRCTLFSWAAFSAAAFAQQPYNDLCENAQLVNLTALPVELTGSTVNAGDDDAASCSSGFGGKDVFFRFTLAAPTDLRIDTSGSTFDTVLSIRGGSCAEAVEIECNDDFQGITSRLDLNQLPAGDYTVLLDGFDPGQSGAYVIRFEAPTAPMNDACGQATGIVPGKTIGSTLGATDAPDRRIPGLPSDGPDVFHRFMATAPQMRLDTLGSRFDTTLAIYAGCGGALVGSNDDFGGTPQSLVDLSGLMVGAEYIVQIDGPAGSAGLYELQLLETQTPPANNICTNSAAFTPIPSVQVGDTNFAANLSSPTEGGDGPEVFYRVQIPEGGNLVIETEGSSFDTVVYVRRGTCTGPQVGYNDDFLGLKTSRLVFEAMSGDDYFIFVDSKIPAHRGPFRLQLSSSLSPPNDDCLSAAPLDIPSTVSGSTEFASDSRNAAVGGCESQGPEVVYEFTLATERRVGFNTLGSDFDTVLYLVEGECGAESVLACNDDAEGLTSALADFEETPLPAGDYRLYVDGSLESGNFVLNSFYLDDEPTPTPTPTGTLTETPTETPSETPTRTMVESPESPDVNGDGRVDLFDLLFLLDQRRTGIIPEENSADFDGSEKVDYWDLFYYSAYWYTDAK